MFNCISNGIMAANLNDSGTGDKLNEELIVEFPTRILHREGHAQP